MISAGGIPRTRGRTASSNGEHITNNTPITISSEIPTAEIHYTTNGAQPTLSSQLYAGPFPASAGMTVEGQAWVPNYAPSDVTTGTFDHRATREPVERPIITSNAYPARWYWVEYSDDLVTWTALSAYNQSDFGGPITITA